MNHESLHQRSVERDHKPSERLAKAEKIQPRHELSEQELETAKRGRHEKLEHARQEIKEIALEPKPDFTEEPPPPAPLTKREKLVLYKQTLRHLQQELPNRSSKTFSKFIHQPSIEKVSEVAAKTIARPSLSLGASLGALLGGSGVYITAKHYGFPISGTEFIIFGMLGATIGLAGEMAKNLWRKAHPG